MTERERFESWARQRWTHPEDFDQRIKAPSKYNNYEVQAAWEAWQERAAQPAPSVLAPKTGKVLLGKSGLCAESDTPKILLDLLSVEIGELRAKSAELGK